MNSNKCTGGKEMFIHIINVCASYRYNPKNKEREIKTNNSHLCRRLTMIYILYSSNSASSIL